MRFLSTAGRAPPADLRTAVFQGLAPDGGLYLPSPLEPLAAGWELLRGATLHDTARVVAPHLFGPGLEPAVLAEVLRHALDFPIPLVQLDDRTYVLELFHGPTLAFKDVGARVLARLMSVLRDPSAAPLTVLTATSGDTGGAVADAFFGVPGIKVVVLYPAGQVSPLQERQFATLGGNVHAVAVAGTFDDCQRLAKEAFGDDALRTALTLTSANSINIGRLLPQALYYAHAWAQLPVTRQPVVSVPSGNFGNLTAGLMARFLGLPIGAFVAATNANDVVPEFLRTGEFRPRPSTSTISNAMDVGDPSNFARMLTLYHGDRAALRRDVTGIRVTDDETRATIRRVFQRHHYVLDPHSAVAYSALETVTARRPEAVGVVLATAHPAKFAEIVEPVIGASIPLPERLSRLRDRTPAPTGILPRFDDLRGLLLSR